MAYSPERKAPVLTKMLPPNNMPLGQLAKEEGISHATLTKWRAEARAKGQFLPDANSGPEGWTSRDKHSAVIETAAMNAADLGEYCRRRGIYPEQLSVWREACERANDWERPRPGSRARRRTTRSGSRNWNGIWPARRRRWRKPRR